MLLPDAIPPDIRNRPHVDAETAAGALVGASSVPPLTAPDEHDLAEMTALDGAFVVRVEVGGAGTTRTYVYKTIGAAERAVERAVNRGRAVSVYMCSLRVLGPVAL
jgi:hypothetical protein